MGENLNTLPIQELERRAQHYYSERMHSRALPYIQKLVALGRTEPQMRVYEAQTLYYNRRAPEAATILRELIAHDPANTHYPLILSQYERAMGNFDESLQLLARVPQESAGYPGLMGWHQMRLGNFALGFEFFAKEPGIITLSERLKLPPEKMMKKGDDIRGKTVLYLMEGGFGDEVLFSRFVPAIENLGAHVLVGASRRIIEILQGNNYIKNLKAIEDIMPGDYDMYLPAIALIQTLGISDPMSGVTFPYMSAPASEVEKWRPIIEREAAGKKKIGIHWQGNWEFDEVEMKSPPAHLMLKFAELGWLFSLQRDAGKNSLPKNAPVFDAEAEAPSWAATAAVISQMDYVVTNDTSTAHLAAAMGKKTLVLLLHAPHFYYTTKEHTSIWYPTMYTFRQPAYNDWPGAVENAYNWIKNHG